MDTLLFGAWVITLLYAVPSVSPLFGKQGSYAASYLASLVFIMLYHQYLQGQTLLQLISSVVSFIFPPLIPEQLALFIFSTAIFAGLTIVSRRQKKIAKKEVLSEIRGVRVD